ncbi:mkiaa1466 protein, partial [Lynx pardinus]
MEEGEPNYDCSEVVDEVHASHLDLQDQAKISPEITLFSDGSSYLQEGSRRARYAVTTTTEVLEAKALPEGWSAQGAEPEPSSLAK